LWLNEGDYMLDTYRILIYDEIMHKLGGRKIFLFGFIAVLLIGIPVTIYLVQQQQETRTRAAKSTTLTFTPDSSANAPIQKNVGDEIPLDIFVDPGTNLVSWVKLEIQYDPEKLEAGDGAFTQNVSVFPSVLEGPVYSKGKIAVTLSVGSDPTKAIQVKSKAATVSFKALATTPPGQPTLVSYGATTQALSIGFNDQASENVLSSATPANIAIGGESVTPTVTIPPGDPTPTIPTTPTVPVTITPPLSGTPSANIAPVCSLLSVDGATSGAAPLSLSLTATGTDGDDTISKVTFNFGDGGVVDVTDAGGVGTASVSAQTQHTYTTGGTFTASAILTDSKGGISDSASCRQTITVTASGGATTAPTDTPVPTLPPTGSTGAAMAIGAVIMAIVIGGGFLFFFL
jgi:hypothetical protein